MLGRHPGAASAARGGRRGQAALRANAAASTSSIGLVIAAITFASAFIVAQLMVAEPGGMDPRPARLDAAATTALDLIIRDPGRTINEKSWANDADTLARFGLAQEELPNFLDYAKIKALRNGTAVAVTNDAPDYPEVKDALGIEHMDFHLRSYPVLPSLTDPRWTKDTSGRIAYFAHYSGATAPAYLLNWTNTTTTSLNVSVLVRNDAADDATYGVSFRLGDKDTRSTWVTAERHTALLRPGESQVLWHEFLQLQSWHDDIDAVLIEVVDPYGNLAVDINGDTVGSAWVPAVPPEGGSRKAGLLVSAADRYYESGDTVTFIADHHDGEGVHLTSNAPSARFVLFGPNGHEWVNVSTGALPLKKNKVWSYDCTNCTAVGNYTAVLWDDAVTTPHVEHVHVSAAQMFNDKTTPDPLALREMQILESLVTNFNDTRYHTSAAPDGDVFGDDTNGPSDILGVLSRYTTLVIGSEVSQDALTPHAVKQGIAEWVQAGGNLVVLGTNRQESRWLEPVYHVAQETANGGISAPDPTHPVLTVPNRLEYQDYLDRARAWRLKTGDNFNGQYFTHVLTRGSSPNYVEDTLAVSEPGAYNDGMVVLTSYMPGALTDPQDDLEAQKLLHNLLSQSHSMLFLDYGPPIPDGVPVGTAQRLVAVPHPNVPGAIVEVRLVMYMW